MTLRFTVYGPPQGKGRPRHGKGFTFTPAKTVCYEQTITGAAVEALRGQPAPLFPLLAPLVLEVRTYMPRPLSRPKAIPLAEWKAGTSAWHLGKPDADNVLKAIADALNGVAYHDDSQVCRAIVESRYCAVGEVPRVEVAIFQVGFE